MAASRSLVALVGLATAATVATASLAAPKAPGSAVANGQIAWKTFPRPADENTAAIYAANPDGSHRHRLTHPGTGVVDDLPDWSPDGSALIFERLFQPSANPPTVPDEVMRVNADGSGVRQIGSCRGLCVGNDDPQYSPDGRRIVFSRAMRAKPNGPVILGVWVMTATGGAPHQITQLAGRSDSEDHEPAWSPDGKRIVFTRINDTAAPAGKQALFIVGASGGNARRITPWSLEAGGANWSHDGSTILFQTYRDCSCSETSQVDEVSPAGSGLRQLTNSGRNIEPSWSPDDTRIVYAHQPGVGAGALADLWSMDASGKHKKPLVQTRLWESEPDWGTARPVR